MVQIVMAGRNYVTAPPALDPFIRIDFPSRVIKHGVDSHHHEQRKRNTYMERDEQRHDREEPSRADRLYRVERKARPRRWLNRAVVPFMSIFK